MVIWRRANPMGLPVEERFFTDICRSIEEFQHACLSKILGLDFATRRGRDTTYRNRTNDCSAFADWLWETIDGADRLEYQFAVQMCVRKTAGSTSSFCPNISINVGVRSSTTNNRDCPGNRGLSRNTSRSAGFSILAVRPIVDVEISNTATRGWGSPEGICPWWSSRFMKSSRWRKRIHRSQRENTYSWYGPREWLSRDLHPGQKQSLVWIDGIEGRGKIVLRRRWWMKDGSFAIESGEAYGIHWWCNLISTI